jgi:hypothetical protein
MAEIVTGCPCGEPHAMSEEAWAAFCSVTKGLPETILAEMDGQSWRVPRVYIAVHGLKGTVLPVLAERYGWERAEPSR